MATISAWTTAARTSAGSAGASMRRTRPSRRAVSSSPSGAGPGPASMGARPGGRGAATSSRPSRPATASGPTTSRCRAARRVRAPGAAGRLRPRKSGIQPFRRTPARHSPATASREGSPVQAPVRDPAAMAPRRTAGGRTAPSTPAEAIAPRTAASARASRQRRRSASCHRSCAVASRSASSARATRSSEAMARRAAGSGSVLTGPPYGRAQPRRPAGSRARRRPKAGVSETVASRRSRAAPPGPDRRRIEGVAGAESPPASG